MTVENLHGRSILSSLLKNNIPIKAIIVEHKSKLAENTRNYLKNNFYNPKMLDELIKNKNIDIHYVENHNDDCCENLLTSYSPDYVILGGTRILKDHIIKTAKYGFINSHPAILPQYHGLDCVGWSILNDDLVGATIHFIDIGIDSGPIIKKGTITYDDCKSLIEVRIKAMKKCISLLVDILENISPGSIKSTPQDKTLGKKYPALPEDKIKVVEEKIFMNKI
tara:strand:+ start:9782 stop:10450 length:669 start_codon:yes stop_codon:yes gene_type:complete